MLIWLQFHPPSNSCSVQREHPCSATVPCLPLCLSSSDSRTQHCCQGYHLLILVHNFEPHHQASAWLIADTGTESSDTHTHTQKTDTQTWLCVHLMCIVNKSTYNEGEVFEEQGVHWDCRQNGKWNTLGTSDPLWSLVVMWSLFLSFNAKTRYV